MYELFSELAGHPNMKSAWMMRPQKDGKAVIGPFIETTTIAAVLSEMGRLAVQVGEILDAFLPADWREAHAVRHAFAEIKLAWLLEYYPSASKPIPL